MGGIAGIKGKSPSTYDTRPPGSGGSQESDPVLVLRPGGVASGNVYVDFASLAAAALAVQGPKTVFVDLSITETTYIVPTGAYDLGPFVTYEGDPFFTSLQIGINFPAGVTIAELPLSFLNLYVTSNSAAPIVSFSTTAPGTPNPTVFVDGNSVLRSFAAPIVEKTAGISHLAIIISGTGYLQNAGAPVFKANDVTVCYILTQGKIDANVLACVTGSNALSVSDQATYSLTQIGPSTVAVFRSIASQEAYTPTVLANWSGVSPTSVANALDRIAAKITPIP